jgi:hypothetical protein
VAGLLGRVIWEVYPETLDSPFELHYRRVAATGEPASFEGWYEPLHIWFQVDAFRTDGGLVVTYDDVTRRHRTEEERAAAIAAREEAAIEAALAAARAEESGRHLMLLGDINLAMTSTIDIDEAVDRFAHLVVPPGPVPQLTPPPTFAPAGTRHEGPLRGRDASDQTVYPFQPAPAPALAPAPAPSPSPVPQLTVTRPNQPQHQHQHQPHSPAHRDPSNQKPAPLSGPF